jgi:hypothetical protein
LNNPKRVYFDSSSNSFYIDNTGSNNVVYWILNDTSWILVAVSTNGASGSISTLLNNSLGVALDSMSNIYVADKNNHCIQFCLSGETNDTTITGVTDIPVNNSILLNSSGSVVINNKLNVYIPDSSNVRVELFSLY